jgi:hypothetical protein
MDDSTKDKLSGRIKLDPIRTPVLYADSIHISSNSNGVVIDVAQRITGSKNAVVVSRIGMSREHAKKLAESLTMQLSGTGLRMTDTRKKVIN